MGYNGNGTLNINNGAVVTSPSINVGYNGNGTLNIENGSVVNGYGGTLGINAGSSGTANVSGPGSTWNASSGLAVGGYGAGTLNITNGGLVNASVGVSLVLWGEINGTGVINFDNGTLNTGSIIATMDELLGTGTINTGGLISDIDLVFDASHGYQQQFVLNSLPGQNITINLDASGTENIIRTGAGYWGTSSLTIADGMSLSSYRGGYIGYHPGSMGTVTVAGPGSTWEIGDHGYSVINVGNHGTGILNIENGGVVNSYGNNDHNQIGNESGSTGTVNISGSGSSWNCHRINIGNYGTGILNIDNGGIVNSGSMYLGDKAGSSGSVTVSGPGSTMNTSSLRVGIAGTGTLLIENQAVVNSTRAIIGAGTVTVTGSGSVWNVTETLEDYKPSIGAYGTGILNIKNGGEVNSNFTHLGPSISYTGTVNVTGPGSTWNNEVEELYIGYTGGGSLNIENGGVVNNGAESVIYLRSNSGTPAKVIVSGLGSTWNGGELYVGYFGDSPDTLSIEDGGVVNNTHVHIIGFNNGSNVTVSGEGSAWNISEDLIVGSYVYTSVLMIENGGRVQANGVTRVNPIEGSYIYFNQGTLDTGGVTASPSQLLGNGVINTKGWICDFDLVFDASHGLQHQFVLNSLPDQNITVNLDVSDPQGQGILGIGENTTSSLTIADGLTVTSLGGGSIGPMGTATVTGPGSTWEMGDSKLVVSAINNNGLFIENGGTVNCHTTSAGRNVTVNGPGSILNTNSLSGGFNIENGGVINSHVGRALSGTTVSGPGSIWNSRTRIYVNGSRDESLRIEDGGVVNTRVVYFGNSVTWTSKATVSGDGSVWNIDDDFMLGHLGHAILNIENGGVVNNNDRIIFGDREGTSGTVSVTGQGSTWNTSGTLFMGRYGTGTLNIQNGGEVHFNSPVNLNIAYYSSSSTATVNLSGGVLDIGGGKIMAGPGNAAFNFTGGTLTNAAKIDLGQPFVQQGGTLAPGGSIGQTDIIGDYSLTAGTVAIELGGVGSPHDLVTVTVTGNIDIALLNTTLDLQILGWIQPGTYSIIETTGGILTGMFENIIGLDIYPGQFDVQYTTTAVTLTLSALSGDLTGDGFVGIEDLNIVLSGWDQTVPPWDLTSGDATGDGFVGIEDLNLVLGNWNAGIPPLLGVDVLATVPEPGTVGLFAVVVLCGCGRQYRFRAA